ncbi:hypothetical protein F4778DRAFT_756118 [Xylariomycetidae sp. FL2044]|nr:hypothetical protein F4778DRAFT_756118 [Xylariomycetidae sp. FL2044]
MRAWSLHRRFRSASGLACIFISIQKLSHDRLGRSLRHTARAAVGGTSNFFFPSFLTGRRRKGAKAASTCPIYLGISLFEPCRERRTDPSTMKRKAACVYVRMLWIAVRGERKGERKKNRCDCESDRSSIRGSIVRVLHYIAFALAHIVSSNPLRSDGTYIPTHSIKRRRRRKRTITTMAEMVMTDNYGWRI